MWPRAHLGFAAVVVTTLLLLVGCDPEREGAESNGDQRSPMPTDTFTATASPSPTGAGTEMPGDWAICSNDVHEYDIGYPEDWHTEHPRPRDACKWFDPDEFDLEPQTEGPLTAMFVNPSRRPFEEAVDGLDSHHKVESVEDTEIAGRAAVRYERVQTEDLLLPEGTRSYGYFVDYNGRAFHIRTVDPPDSDFDYERSKSVVDDAAQSLSLGEER